MWGFLMVTMFFGFFSSGGDYIEGAPMDSKEKLDKTHISENACSSSCWSTAMLTFAAIALDRLLETGASKPVHKFLKSSTTPLGQSIFVRNMVLKDRAMKKLNMLYYFHLLNGI